MSYKKNYRQYNKANEPPAGELGSTETAAVIPLDSRKQVTVRKYNGMSLVDIREFYVDKGSGEKKPGKKGISLTRDVWNLLLSKKDLIQLALDDLDGTQTAAAVPGTTSVPAPKNTPAPKDNDDSDFNEDDFEDVLNKELLLQEAESIKSVSRPTVGSKRVRLNNNTVAHSTTTEHETDVSDADD